MERLRPTAIDVKRPPFGEPRAPELERVAWLVASTRASGGAGSFSSGTSFGISAGPAKPSAPVISRAADLPALHEKWR